MSKRLTILHTNDIHGRIQGLARVATLVAEARANTKHPVLYFDAGDTEDTTTHLSSLTKGSDAELKFSTSLVEKEWQLKVEYHADVIMCEVLEQYMVKHKHIMPRVE
jgi:hypothetical protein